MQYLPKWSHLFKHSPHFAKPTNELSRILGVLQPLFDRQFHSPLLEIRRTGHALYALTHGNLVHLLNPNHLD
jgi:hypothetical protein